MDYFEVLSPELLHVILDKLDYLDLPQIFYSCKKIRQIVENSFIDKKKKIFFDQLIELASQLEVFTFEGKTANYDTERLHILLQTLVPIPIKYCQSFIFLLTRIYGVKQIRNNARIKRLISLLLRTKSQDDFLAYLCNQDFVLDTRNSSLEIGTIGIKAMVHFKSTRGLSYESLIGWRDYDEIQMYNFIILYVSKILYSDALWDRLKFDKFMQSTIPSRFIPYHTILLEEFAKARPVESIKMMFTLKDIKQYYDQWSLWERIFFLRYIERHLQTGLDPKEYLDLIDYAWSIVRNRIEDREKIANGCGEYFGWIDILMRFRETKIQEKILGIDIIHHLSETLRLVQLDYPHRTEIIHGFFARISSLLLSVKFDINTAPDIIENFFVLWCDDPAIKKRKLWFIRRLICPQNVKSVIVELDDFIACEEHERLKGIATQMLTEAMMISP
eukprot:TRINITY_DN9399_c0_g1_i1.p1 TRINITY_DN9399_c0_g1~~TRINITY_DN9399_c0_g1_i1.p1  ORF type:complete len:445 (-),score=50.17 TRINITY_DN9399_c0_g1_i1:642-1976(-)